MSEQPLISICTPVYNGEDFLAECIKGALAQRYPNVEYIIVDNASTDRTPEIIERLCAGNSRVKVYRNESTVTVVENFRKCAEYISPQAKWIKYALADDYLYPNCLDEMLAVGELSETIGLVSAYRLYGGRLTNVGLPPDQSVFSGAEILKKQLLRKLHVCSGSPNTIMYRKSAFDAAGGFDNRYLHTDTELALRLLDKHELGFAHCVFTRTGLHKDRQETRSIYTGLLIRDYLEFGFKNLDNYKSVKFSHEEIDALAGFYARQIVEFFSKKAAHLDYEHIRLMLDSCPSEIRNKLFSTLVSGAGKNLKTFLRELRTMVTK
ncbi:MAG: glycosyltransferase family 2 protein [Acidiferrobacterales bacterium]